MTDVRIVTAKLGGSALSRALQAGTAPRAWYTAAPTGGSGWRERASQRAAERDWTELWRCLAPALAASGQARTRLERVIAAGGVVVTTGQQPGLFCGPIYTLSKAVSAIALADALEAATGIPTAPVFWAATDDADFAEASNTAVARRGGLDVLRSTAAPPAGTPMSLAPLGDLRQQIDRLAAACGSAADPRPLAIVRAAYGSDPSRSVGDAFVEELRNLLEPLGMAVLDASHDAVALASEGVLRRALDVAGEVEQALKARGSEIRDAGFEPQVDEMAGLSLVFGRESMVKRRLAVNEHAAPGLRLTPNVLLRPVLEREILPTVAYVAGPGELAYFAQVGPVADALGVGAPLAVPRWSCTLVEPQVDELLQRLDAAEGDLTPVGALESRLARRALATEASEALTRLRSVIAALPGEMRAVASALDLERAVQGAAGAMRHRADRLERRLVAGVKRRETGLMTDAATVRAALRPLGGRQERVLNPIPILARHGTALLEEMRDVARHHADALVTGEAR